MFKPLPMQRATLYLLHEDVPAAALVLAQLGLFDPTAEPQPQSRLSEQPAQRYRELFQSAQVHLQKSFTHLNLEADLELGSDPPHALSEEELEELDDRLAQIWRDCSACEEIQHRLQQQTRELEQLGKALEKYSSLDINLGLLHGQLRFLDLRVGTIAGTDVNRLRAAVGLIGYSLTVLGRTDGVAHVAVAGLTGAEEQVATVLEAASFRRWEIPSEFRDHPRKLKQDLQARAEKLLEEREQLAQHIEQGRERHGETLAEAAKALTVSAPYARLAEVLRSRGGLAQLSGWVPKDRVGALREALVERLPGRVVIESRDPDLTERLRVPSALSYPRLLRPFAALVRNYGVPRYGEVDPTWLFAITFVVMFGMMFGDIGHGALIALAGALFRHRLEGYAPFVVVAGVASTVFGFFYGSLFGYEGIIHPLWMSPIADPVLMLKLALAWGIGFVFLATGITVRNRMAERRVKEALFDGSGLAGMALYAAGLFGASRWVRDQTFGPLEQVMILIPLAVMLTYKWREFRAPTGERLLVVVIEGFETFMSYVTNTLSFLRVAAFSLNHVALAVAVFTLAEMMNDVGHWITVVLGNLFILILEGAIVAIQVLRLEYYEGFSRFFSGDGRAFRPLTLARGLG